MVFVSIKLLNIVNFTLSDHGLRLLGYVSCDSSQKSCAEFRQEMLISILYVLESLKFIIQISSGVKKSNLSC